MNLEYCRSKAFYEDGYDKVNEIPNNIKTILFFVLPKSEILLLN